MPHIIAFACRANRDDKSDICNTETGSVAVTFTFIRCCLIPFVLQFMPQVHCGDVI